MPTTPDRPVPGAVGWPASRAGVRRPGASLPAPLFATLLAATLLAPTPLAAQLTEYSSSDGRVRATDGARLVWENVHDRGGVLRREGTPGRLTPPVVVGRAVFYAVGNQLYQVDAVDGRVRNRVPLPGGCVALRAEADGLVVGVAGVGAGAWSREYTLDSQAPALPFFLGSGLAARLLRSDAEAVADQLLRTAAGQAPDGGARERAWRRSEAARPLLEAALEPLQRLAERDPTNPWYDFERGLILADLGRSEQARRLLESVVEADERWSGELLGMALPLDQEYPELGERAFERGLGYLVARGYDPGMNRGLLSVMIHYGRPALQPAPGAERLEQLASRLWRLAPQVEGAAQFYAGVAQALDGAGRGADAAVWREHAREVWPAALLLPAGRLAALTGPALNGVVAALLALLLSLFVKGVRYLPTQRRAGRAGWNPLSLWTRGELVGLLLVAGLFVSASWTAARGLVAIGRAASLPIEAVAGSYGHPAAVDAFAAFAGSPGGDFVYALALHKAARLEEAAALYSRLGDARSLNNLGALRAAQGDPAAAAELFRRAHALAPRLAEPAVNAGDAAAATPRLTTLSGYGASGPWLALPSERQWDEALVRPASPLAAPGQILESFQGMSVIARSSPPAPPLARAAAGPGLLTALLLLIVALALAGLVRRPVVAPVSSRVSRLGWGLGLLVPGTARQLGPLGPPLLALAGFSLLVDRSLALSGGAASDLLSAVTLSADLTRAFGAWARLHTPLELWIRGTASGWWLLVLLNPVLVLALERWRPDPCGPRSAAPEPVSS